jgi:hypothetical protein
VLGHSGAADRQLGGQLADSAGTFGELLDDGAPGGIAEGIPPGTSVSRHER